MAPPPPIRLFRFQRTPHKSNSPTPLSRNGPIRTLENVFLHNSETVRPSQIPIEVLAPLGPPAFNPDNSENVLTRQILRHYANEIFISATARTRLAKSHLVILQRQQCWRHRSLSAQKSWGSAGSVGGVSVQAQAPAQSGELRF